ncbi:TetR/AcrR family transcriptional regulator [Vagococcus sp.]|uniref:TetR/AcrR family transcriptional regulator n=1 Tax=Vagococcus sp. TaxID=1933889 RepID=UPI003F98D4A6
MPSETFFRLDEEKQNKIMAAAKQEFSKHAYHDAAISNIIKIADIPRGSFYQYFKDKQDLFFYCILLLRFDLEDYYSEMLQVSHGDFFETFYLFFNYFVEEVFLGAHAKFYKNFIVYMDFKASHQMLAEDKVKELKQKRKTAQPFSRSFEKMNLENLKVKDFAEMKQLAHLIVTMMFLTINEGYRLEKETGEIDIDQVKKSFETKLTWLKYGVMKGKE